MNKIKKVTIIAEAGVNHNGNFENAKKLVQAASVAGADYIKFQTFKTDKLVSKKAKKADYQIKNIADNDDTQYGMLKKLEMPEHWHHELIEYCKEFNINFLSTAFDIESIDLLDSLNLPLFKVPSGEITNKPYLQHIAKKGKPLILSTGMATLQEVKDALAVLEDSGMERKDVTVLHCNTQYPTDFDDVNLLAMNQIREECGVKTGYSDHTMGLEVPIAAVALGAVVLEKHFTLDRKLPGPDHKASLEPNELKQMVRSIRNVEKAISGDGVKRPSKGEKDNIGIVRKSLHLEKDIKKGEEITRDHLIVLRPGDGISPMVIDEIVGRKVNKDLSSYSQLKMDDLK